MKPDLSGCHVLEDCEGVELESGKPFSFTCCDCGLTHHIVIVSEDGKPVGFAVKRIDGGSHYVDTRPNERAAPRLEDAKPPASNGADSPCESGLAASREVGKER